ncbi:MAG: J domain-containing protein [Acetobacteraceae bacterium]|nr:J domain-containing protein [Acetobacteraceae bacterium]
MRSPYDILGVTPTASAAEIRTAYRRLAKQKHPDINPGNKNAAEEFAAISSAYALLSDADKRARFDRGEIDATGAEVPPQRTYWRDHSGAGHHRAAGGFDPADLEELLRQAAGGRRRGPARGEDARYTLTVSFMDAALGTVRRLTLPDGKTLDVTIPPGHRDGQILRLRGQGNPGFSGGPPGDALIEIAVAPHRFYRRDGDDISLDLPVTMAEAILGARVAVPTLTGPVTLTIPPRSGPGTRLRLRGRGIGAGHLFVILSIVLPTEPEPALEEFLRTWKPDHPQDPRRDMVP